MGAAHRRRGDRDRHLGHHDGLRFRDPPVDVSADFEKSSSAPALAVAGVLWALWIMVSAAMAGGYFSPQQFEDQRARLRVKSAA